MTDLHFRSAKQLASDIRRRKIGCLEALDAFLARVDRFNPKLNAIVVMDVAGARRRAKQADAALKKGKVWGPLHGVPMTIKEILSTSSGCRRPGGCPRSRTTWRRANALAVDRLLAARRRRSSARPTCRRGWPTGRATTTSTAPPTIRGTCPRSPGGSSGGSAAALAAGLTGLRGGQRHRLRRSATPRTTAASSATSRPTGSARRAARRCPAASPRRDISVIGPMARSADDLAIGLAAMAGADEIDGGGLAARPARAARRRPCATSRSRSC